VTFVEDALSRMGLMGVLAMRRQGDLEGARAALKARGTFDLLALGALADLVRAEEIGDVVRIHTTATAEEKDVAWIEAASDLDVLRAVALARVSGVRGCRVGFDWSRRGLELAQVALGFGASDLRGAITKKSGLPILETEARKVKGQGMVELSALKKREIAALVQHARRVPVFVAEDGRLVAPPPVQQQSQEAAGV
jgi:hypothetical protein